MTVTELYKYAQLDALRKSDFLTMRRATSQAFNLSFSTELTREQLRLIAFYLYMEEWIDKEKENYLKGVI